MSNLLEAYDAAGQVSTLLKVGGPLRQVAAERTESNEYRAALQAYNLALRETVTYIEKIRSGVESYDPQKEATLSELWSQASVVVATFDPHLANQCFIKGQGWLNPTVWNDSRYKKYHIGIDDMREALMDFTEKQHARSDRVPGWFAIAGLVFAAATFVSLFYLLLGPDLSTQKKIIFNAWVAFCVAASAAFLGGTAVSKGSLKIPFMKDAPVQFVSYGGVGVFVLVFLILLAANR